MVGKAKGPQDLVGVDEPSVVVEPLEDLFANDPFFDLEPFEQRLSVGGAQQSEDGFDVLGWYGHRENTVIHAGAGIQSATELFERERLSVCRWMPRCAPVEHVFEEVADTIIFPGLESRARSYVDADHGTVDRRHRNDDQPASVRQCRRAVLEGLEGHALVTRMRTGVSLERATATPASSCPLRVAPR
jgi:hypothetical protein